MEGEGGRGEHGLRDCGRNHGESEGDAATTLRCTGDVMAGSSSSSSSSSMLKGLGAFVGLGRWEGIAGACGKGGRWMPGRATVHSGHGAGVVSCLSRRARDPLFEAGLELVFAQAPSWSGLFLSSKQASLKQG